MDSVEEGKATGEDVPAEEEEVVSGVSVKEGGVEMEGTEKEGREKGGSTLKKGSGWQCGLGMLLALFCLRNKRTKCDGLVVEPEHPAFK